ncbi:fused MFS/spermidine synthase [candidate division KSB1 bacterium]
MSKKSKRKELISQTSHRGLPLLVVLFFGSGCAALMYEIVWFQMLELVIGSSSVSLGILLATFMGGMCIGSLLLPRFISAKHHPLRVYSILELGIGIFGIVLLFAIPLVGHLYSSVVGRGLPGIFLRGIVCALLLLPPTVLMGATLPAIGRWVESTSRGVSWLGFFYCGNIFGAVFGCLLAGFYLLRVHDMVTATCVAAAVNLIVALAGFTLARFTPGSVIPVEITQKVSKRPWGNRRIYVAIAISGLCALGAEVIWTRLLSLIIGATVYTFSIILAVFLLGLGIGSSVGSFIARESRRPWAVFGYCQLLLVAAVAWSALILTRSLPYWPTSPTLFLNPWYNFQFDLVRCIWAILPAACLWGASFPLALAAATSRDQDSGRLVGGIYAANTVGAIIGALGFSMIITPWLGTQKAQQTIICLSALAALLLLIPVIRQPRTEKPAGSKAKRFLFRYTKAVPLAIMTVFVAVLTWTVPSTPSDLIAYGRKLLDLSYGKTYLYTGEGMNASIAVSELEDGIRNFHVSGKVVASSDLVDMRLQRMLGHLPALIHGNPRSVLVVGFGAGVTAGSFLVYPEVERVVICEIEPLIPEVASRYFGRENHNVFDDPRVEIIYDDARHYINTTEEKFDIITSDPIHPWVKGAATLYTREYFELLTEHLHPGGIITQWVPLYESSPEVVKSELATFFEVFPRGTVWSNDLDGGGYDIVLIGHVNAIMIDVEAIQNRIYDYEHLQVVRSLTDVEFWSLTDLFATYSGKGSDMASWLRDAEINRDRNLRLQYLGGMGLNYYLEDPIYDAIVNFRSFPDDLFIVPDYLRQELLQKMSIR